MSASKQSRPGLDALPFATKKQPLGPFSVTNTATPLDELPTHVPEPEAAETAKGKADNRVTIILRVEPEDRRQLKIISARDGRTIQDMLHEAVRDIIRRST